MSAFREILERIGSTSADLGRHAARSFRHQPLRSTLLAGFGSAAIATAAFLVWALHDLPWGRISAGSKEPVVMLAASGGEALPHRGPFRSTYVELNGFPEHLVDAVTSAEDRRFFWHLGVDPLAISRALFNNIAAGSVVEGGSTITQQLAKISYLSTDRSLKRKVQEAAVAIWLDVSLGKDEVLTRYLNSIFLGSGAIGVPAAAQVYFGKDVRSLSLPESAMLAGLIRAPSNLNPVADLDASRKRAAEVLDDMAANGKIDAAALKSGKAGLAKLEPAAPQHSASWFADWVSADARALAKPARGRLRIATTLDMRLQALAEEAVQETMAQLGERHGATQAALVAMTAEGAVVAMVGGRDYGESQFNRAVTALRQPGSTFKLFVYHAALRAGMPLNARVIDRPIEIDGWEPKNIGNRYRGRISAAEAFARSINMPAVALTMHVGIDKVIASARELGIDAELAATPSLALGTSEVSLLDLTGAFASVRAGVTPIEPFGIVSYSAEGQGGSTRVGPARPPVSNLPEQAELITLLRLVVERGTGRAADFNPLAVGKTGTSQDYRDAWFVGFAGPLVAGVWVGNDDNTPMRGVTGGELPALIWRSFMEEALGDAAVDTEAVTASIKSESDEVPACNVRACSRAYRSFRAGDCTFQPYGRGPRQLCRK